MNIYESCSLLPHCFSEQSCQFIRASTLTGCFTPLPLPWSPASPALLDSVVSSPDFILLNCQLHWTTVSDTVEQLSFQMYFLPLVSRCWGHNTLWVLLIHTLHLWLLLTSLTLPKHARTQFSGSFVSLSCLPDVQIHIFKCCSNTDIS